MTKRMFGRMIQVTGMLMIAVMAVTWIASADTINVDGDSNTVAVNGSVTVSPGGTGSAKAWLIVDDNSTDPVNGCNANGPNPVTIAFQANPAVVAFNPASGTVSGCDSTNAVTTSYTVNAAAAAGSSIIVTASASGGKSGGNGSFTAGTFIINIPEIVVPTDNTPPVITYMLNPASPDGSNDWYTSDVTLTWTVTENESTSSLVKTGCVDQSITADQAETTYSCSASSAGGSTAPVNVSIKRDATAPVITQGAITGDEGNNGWYTSDVSVAFTATDATSGLANATDASFSLPTTGEGMDVSTGDQTVFDNAGNSAIAGPLTFNVDKTAPVVSVTGVAQDAIYTLGSVPTAGCSTTDATSDVAANASAALSGGNANGTGSITATCSGAIDNAGNAQASEVSVSYNVRYAFDGFFRPVDMNGIVNSVKAGSAVPVKFSLSGYQGLNIFAAGFPKLVLASCSATASVDPVEETVTAGNSSLSYDAATDQYTYVWKTDKAWAGKCGTLQVQLNDGSVAKVASFKFLK